MEADVQFESTPIILLLKIVTQHYGAFKLREPLAVNYVCHIAAMPLSSSEELKNILLQVLWSLTSSFILFTISLTKATSIMINYLRRIATWVVFFFCRFLSLSHMMRPVISRQPVLMYWIFSVELPEQILTFQRFSTIWKTRISGCLRPGIIILLVPSYALRPLFDARFYWNRALIEWNHFCLTCN